MVLAVVSVGVDSANYYNYQIELGDDFPLQLGQITHLRLQKGLVKGLISEKSHLLDNIPLSMGLNVGDVIEGTADVPGGMKKWKKVSLLWNRDEDIESGYAKAPIRVKRITFTPDMDAEPRELSKLTKIFCFDGPIESAQEVTFKDCTPHNNEHYIPYSEFMSMSAFENAMKQMEQSD